MTTSASNSSSFSSVLRPTPPFVVSSSTGDSGDAACVGLNATDRATCNVSPAAGGTPGFSRIDALNAAVDRLMTPPSTGQLNAQAQARAFSESDGCQQLLLDLNDNLALRGPRLTSAGQMHRLGGAYRHWGVPANVSIPEQADTDARDQGSDRKDFCFGNAHLSLSPDFSRIYRRESEPAHVTARLYSSQRRFSEQGQWHGALSALVQDIWLSGLTRVIPLSEPVQTHAEAVWPTLGQSSLLRLEHGLGIPVVSVAGVRTALAFSDLTEESLMSLEGNLFVKWLYQQVQTDGLGWNESELNAVLTPALARWVLDCRQNPPANTAELCSSLFPFLVGQPSSSAGSTPKSLQSQVRDDIAYLAREVDADCISIDAITVLRASRDLLAVVDGLAALQDRIRYASRGNGCELPEAGLERAYLNSLLRTLVCASLDLMEPAEVAQFDLLLRARRTDANVAFNDHSVNWNLVRHLEWVAQTQEGCGSGKFKVLQLLTQAQQNSTEKSMPPILFHLDEYSRETA